MTLKVGTDCSGIEAPIQALKKLKIPFTHQFSSEIDSYCIQSIKANYNPERIYGDPEGEYPEGDIRLRDHTQLPDIDLYVCGFPCQPFSTAGKRKGENDTRGDVFWACLDTIKVKQPKLFILENVRGLLTANKGQIWEKIWTSLTELEGYTVEYKLLNTKDYGIPQNRERLYIVGKKEGEVKWPKIKKCKDLKKFVDNTNTDFFHSKSKVVKNITNTSIFVNIDFLKYTTFPEANKICPCVGSQATLWCNTYHRYATVKEYLMLQGFSVSFKQVVSNTQLKKQLGNSMSVNVIFEILKSNIY